MSISCCHSNSRWTFARARPSATRSPSRPPQRTLATAVVVLLFPLVSVALIVNVSFAL
jgi:hypothetical protein